MNNILVLDVENSVSRKAFQKRDGSGATITQMLPFTPGNRLVSIGTGENPDDIADTEYFCFYHNEKKPDEGAFAAVQKKLDTATLLIGHNIKHDMHWLRACGFKYDGDVWDTAIVEYVLSRGVKRPLKLKLVLERYDLPRKRTDLTEGYMADGVGFEAMPWDIVEEYGRGDISSTMALYLHQLKLLETPENQTLKSTVKMMCTFTPVVQEMEYNGLKIDFDALAKVEDEYVEELRILSDRLKELASGVMGDTPIRLTSNDFLSELLYSRRVKDKSRWKELFNIGKDARGKDLMKPRMTKSKFNAQVRANTEVIRKTEVKHCKACDGRGYYQKMKKDGTPWKNTTKCPECNGEGFIYTSTGVVGGFKLVPKGVSYTSASGFAAGKEVLAELLEIATGDAHEFLTKMVRYNAITSYLSSFVDGMRKYAEDDAILHCSLNQTITATARLSSSNPNFQNQPRGNTFPVRRAVASRFEGGSILEFDYAQLEFRIAGFLSGCKVLRDFVESGQDAHKFSKDTINGFDPTLPQIDRQDAKPHTFKPLYGGMSGTPRERHYYQSFLKLFTGVADWQEALKREALATKKIRLPSGREYHFPYVKRLASGYVQESTKIVNYPVQGFATGDIVPLAGIAVHRLIREAQKSGLKSLLILTVHDSLVCDVYPGEEETMVEIMQRGMLSIPELCKEFYDLDFEYPIQVEGKIGPNWLDTKEIGKYDKA